ncbi:YbaK/EbsC family protein [Branchiibius sp. NY16-3462-2]|uniref:YbaK/EbsC family protein n=1 Tax=Branchiibius sp. NY16-3462-2 TaxID=1807500 RepID=UPI000796A42E|nr:YbaK/EbsC family protein [Branchiibius sp. NY16-3462-2]KYH44590.1 hypothetical protein AZH51_07835 [Branchiibius sp. NY16-3462-2]
MTSLLWQPAASAPELMAPSTAAAVAALDFPDEVDAVAIDPAISDTAALVEATGMDLADSANCVIVAGKRDGVERVAALLVLATTRADINNVVRRHLDVRKISFMPMDDAVARTQMEYGGITPIGLPADWPVLVDSAVLQRDSIVIGSGIRAGKLRIPGARAAQLPNATVIEGMARVVDA